MSYIFSYFPPGLIYLIKILLELCCDPNFFIAFFLFLTKIYNFIVLFSFSCSLIKLHNFPMSYLLISFSSLKYLTEIKNNSSFSLLFSSRYLFKNVISEYPPEFPLLTGCNKYPPSLFPSQQFF